MDSFVLSSIVTLFVTLNPIGNIPIFISLLSRFSEKRQRRIILRELFFTLLIMLVFGFLGQEILSSLGLKLLTVRIAGGMILFLIALSLLFPKPATEEAADLQEPFIVPLATPVLAGAGTISLVMVISTQTTAVWQLPVIIFAVWIPALIIILLSSLLKGVLGAKGLVALERFSGLLLIFISVQMIVAGVTEFVQTQVQPLLNG